MVQLSDEMIAKQASLKNIKDIAANLGVGEDALYQYGAYMAKVDPTKVKAQKKGALILVTAINPTPAGEGKTTLTIGLTDAFNRLGKRAVVAVREPSLGPVFGIKGGAAGGGYAQVLPMEEINLHFTGDLHAIGAANNLLAALIDNHIYHGNELAIDPKRVKWRRALDMNDRQLRQIVSGMGGVTDGVMRSDGFDITVASEMMAILCLSSNMSDLKERLARIIVAENRQGEPVYVHQLKAQGALAALLKQAILPNLVQTIEGSPALVHGGPFANIAHGCNSIIATQLAQSLGDITVTEAGFGADLGAEKFLNIKCRQTGLSPNAVVIVATVRALKYNGGVAKNDLQAEDLSALKTGFANLKQHILNIKDGFNLPVAVAINRFVSDTPAELELLQDLCASVGVKAVVCEVWAKGGEGGLAMAQVLLGLLEQEKPNLHFSYENNDSLEEKIRKVATKVYHADGVNLSEQARSTLAKLTKQGFAHLPICMAKTQYSFSDNEKLLGAPSGFYLNVRDVQLASGAGFIIVLCGKIMRMPGLPKLPAAQRIDIDEQGQITGLF